LHPDIVVDAGPTFRRLNGRDAIIGALARLNTTIADLEVRFADVQITVTGDGSSAQVYLTAEARYRDHAGSRGLDARELDISMRRVDGSWLVAGVALVRTLEPLTPK
jgi:hypothetical protein